MATPEVTVVHPAEGRTGGRQLIEVLGQGFQLAPAPPLTGKAPVPNPSVEVLFGGRAGTNVFVVSPSRLFVLTPPLDPVRRSVVFTADAGTDTLTAAGHGLKTAQRGLVKADGDGAALPDGLLGQRYVYIVNPTTNTFQLSYTRNGTPISLADAGTGTLLLVSYEPVDVEVRNIDQAGALVPGEAVTAAAAFTPVRPDLLAQAGFTRLVRYLVLELRRQVIENVDISMNTDYDASPDDGLNITELSNIPGLVLFGPRTRENRFFSTNEPRSLPSTAHSAQHHKRQRPPYTVDLVFTVVGVTDSKVQLLNLQAETQLFFQRNKTLSLPRDPSDPDGEVVELELEVEPGGTVSVVNGTQPNNANIRAFSGTFSIRGFDLDEEDMAVGISRELEDLDTGVGDPSAVSLGQDQLGASFQVGSSPTDTAECS